jgi:hypothetical protein
MPFPVIARVNGLNISGACYVDVVAVGDVLSMPAQEMDNISGDIVLKAGKSWSRVELAPPGSRLVDKWVQVQGEQLSDLSIEGFASMDQLALLPNLWNTKNERYLVLFYGLNGDRLVAGRPEEGCKFQVTERDRGDDQQVVNGYRVSWRLRRVECVPFYNGTPPEDVPVGECPSIDQLVPVSSWATIEGALTGVQLAAAQASICPTLCAMVDAAIVEGGGTGIVISGAGEPTANGTYAFNGVLNGRDSYLLGAWTANWNGSQWYVSNGYDLWYYSDDDVLQPYLVTTWVVDTAAGPAPTVTAEGGSGDASLLTDCLSPGQASVLLNALLTGSTGSTIWDALDGTQRTQLLTAAGVITVGRINNSGPPYTDIIIDPTP